MGDLSSIFGCSSMVSGAAPPFVLPQELLSTLPDKLNNLDARVRNMQQSIYRVAPQPKRQSMFSQVGNDVKSFIVEHRSIIYFVCVALIVDHLLFKGVFRTRLQSVAEKLVSKVEERLA